MEHEYIFIILIFCLVIPAIFVAVCAGILRMLKDSHSSTQTSDPEGIEMSKRHIQIFYIGSTNASTESVHQLDNLHKVISSPVETHPPPTYQEAVTTTRIPSCDSAPVIGHETVCVTNENSCSVSTTTI